MWNTLVDNWLWFLGILAVAFVARQTRLYILRKKKEREEKKDDLPQRYNTGNPYIDAAYEAEKKTHGEPECPDVVKPLTPEIPEPPKPLPNPREVEDFYYKQKRAFEERQAQVDGIVAAANQRAQFMMVQEGKTVRLTIYDPETVESLDKLTVIEEIVDGQKGFVPGGHLYIDDKRPAVRPTQWLPAPAAHAAAETEKRRQKALEDGQLGTIVVDGKVLPRGDQKVTDDIAAAKSYSETIRAQAKKDFEELVPQIRANAEKLAREKFVPKRMEAFQQQAAQDGTTIEPIIEAFVTQVGDQAVANARADFNTVKPLTNSLFMRAVDAGGWQMRDDGTPKPKEEQVGRKPEFLRETVGGG